MREAGDFSPYRQLAFDVRGPCCGDQGCQVQPDLVGLKFKITEVHGTSLRVKEGERYVVRGEYEYDKAGDNVFAVSLAVSRTAFGATAHLAPGAGPFEASIEVLELAKGSPNELGVVVGNKKTGNAGIVRWVMLKP
ncbi:MAG: hypothetical protein ACYS5V_04730 [Planctomycetota bacterium]|jgi:hypothetical protein